jgi:anti-sigma factor RsiW
MWRSLVKRFRKDECDRTKGMHSAYIDQRLSFKEQQEVERHLEVCQRCQEELDTLRATVGLLHRVPQVFDGCLYGHYALLRL